MKTKSLLLICILAGFGIGFVITAFALLAGVNRAQYEEIMTIKKQRVIMAGHDGVTILDFFGNDVKVTKEP